MSCGWKIEKPCDADWNDMDGDERIRACARCRRNVHNLSAMTRRQAERFMDSTRGSECVRFDQRLDGTIQHRPPRWARLLLVAASVVSAPALASGRVDEGGQGWGSWIAEVVADLTDTAIQVTVPLAGEPVMQNDYRAIENRTGSTLFLTCSDGVQQVLAAGEQTTVFTEIGATCSVDDVAIPVGNTACQRSESGLSCAAPAL